MSSQYYPDYSYVCWLDSSPKHERRTSSQHTPNTEHPAHRRDEEGPRANCPRPPQLRARISAMSVLHGKFIAARANGHHVNRVVWIDLDFRSQIRDMDFDKVQAVLVVRPDALA